MATGRSRMLYAYTITTRQNAARGERNFWNRIGTAWENRDGSLNVELFAVPVNGKLQLREPRKDDEGDNG